MKGHGEGFATFFLSQDCGDNEFFKTWGQEKDSQAKFQATEKLLSGEEKKRERKAFSMLTICLHLVYC